MQDLTMQRDAIDLVAAHGLNQHNDEAWLHHVRTELTVIIGRMQLLARRLERGSFASPTELRKTLLELSDHAEELRHLAQVAPVTPHQGPGSVQREVDVFGGLSRRPSSP